MFGYNSPNALALQGGATMEDKLVVFPPSGWSGQILADIFGPDFADGELTYYRNGRLSLQVNQAENDTAILVNQFGGDTDSTVNVLTAYKAGQVTVGIATDGQGMISRAIGFWGHAPPSSQPLLSTGVGHTVDDVIALLQSYGKCRQS